MANINATVAANGDNRLDDAALLAHAWSLKESNGLPVLLLFEQSGTEGFCLAATALAEISAFVLEADVFKVELPVAELDASVEDEEDTDTVTWLAEVVADDVDADPNPVVVVTTATLHNALIPFPLRNIAMIESGSTVTLLHAVVTAPFVSTSPAKHDCEQTNGGLKSDTWQPFMGAR